MKRAAVGAALAATVLATTVAAATEISTTPSTEAVATFAGGCFWCTESDFEKVPGVISAVSGYIGGALANPTYDQVSAGGTGHAEAVQVRYNPKQVSYEQLLEFYWRSVDPTVKDRQFCDEGSQYRTAIFTHDQRQHELAQASKAQVQKQLGVPVYTQVVRATTFYPAEAYHQDFYKKSESRYKFYRYTCGRDRRLEQVWGKHKP